MRNPFQPITLILLLNFFALNTNVLQGQSTWHNQYTSSQIQIDYSDATNCSFSDGAVQAEYIFLKITNLTTHTVKVSFRVDVYYVGTGCGTCNNDEYLYSFNVPASGVIQADCNFTTTGMSKLAVFKKFLSKTNYREFEKFEITGITIE